MHWLLILLLFFSRLCNGNCTREKTLQTVVEVDCFSATLDEIRSVQRSARSQVSVTLVSVALAEQFAG